MTNETADKGERALAVPIAAWVSVGFAVTFLLFFVRPLFFSAATMQFPEYLPVQGRPLIGGDMKLALDFTRQFLETGNPYESGWGFPPLVSLLFLPLLLLRNTIGYFGAYGVLGLTTLACLAATVVALPVRVSRGRLDGAALTLVAASGLVSYGLQFELERGQFHLIATSFAMLAIWMFHGRRDLRPLAYVLFIISVQLKMYPILFVVMFLDNESGWRQNAKRIASLIVSNVALLFVLGPRMFSAFVGTITSTSHASNASVFDHSIRSFLGLLSQLMSQHGFAWLGIHQSNTEKAFIAVVLTCVAAMAGTAWRRHDRGVNAHLLLACTLAAGLITPESHDYKLAILAAPFALFVATCQYWCWSTGVAVRSRFLAAILVVFSIAYSSTLYPPAYKVLGSGAQANSITIATVLANNAPALLVMLLIVTVLYLWLPRKDRLEIRDGETEILT